MDVATLITLLLEKKEEVTRHFQKIAYIKKTAWKKLQVQRMKEMNLGRKITRIPFQNRILHEERKDATTNTAECIHKGKSMFPVFVPIMLLESKRKLSKLPNKYQKDALRTLLFGNSSLCTLYTLFIINILINPMPINAQHKLECLPYFMYVCLSCLMHRDPTAEGKLALKVFMALMNSDADETSAGLKEQEAINLFEKEMKNDPEFSYHETVQTVISALQSVLQEDFKANEIEPRINCEGIRNDGVCGMPNMRANVRRGRKFGFEKSVDELEKELEDYLMAGDWELWKGNHGRGEVALPVAVKSFLIEKGHKAPIAPSPVPHNRNGIPKEIVTTPRFDSPVIAFDFHSIRDDVIAVGTKAGGFFIVSFTRGSRYQGGGFKQWDRISYSLDFRSPDGSLFAHPVDVHVGHVSDLAFLTMDSSLLLVTCGNEHIVKIWDAYGMPGLVSFATLYKVIITLKVTSDLQLGELKELASKYPNRLKVHYVLNQPPKGWTGGVGFVTTEMIKDHLLAPAFDIKILRCGPPSMNKAMAGYLET
ncbi:NADH-cytochrome b5 reductase 1-like protein [Tanacetum coccineum]